MWFAYLLMVLGLLFVGFVIYTNLRYYNDPKARAEARKKGIAVLEPPGYKKPLKRAVKAQQMERNKESQSATGDGDGDNTYNVAGPDGKPAQKIVFKRNR